MAKKTEVPPDHVNLWCGTCHTLVPIKPTHIRQQPREPIVYYVTPDAWTDHRATHGEAS